MAIVDSALVPRGPSIGGVSSERLHMRLLMSDILGKGNRAMGGEKISSWSGVREGGRAEWVKHSGFFEEW